MKPKKLKRSEDNKLSIEWNDNSVSELDIKMLVHCKGETVLFSSYIPIKDPFKAAGFYELEKIEPIGNYAIQIFWKDGHNTGIYSWEYLKELSERENKN